MGYSELHCQLCFISLAIARFRTINEPPEAAWSYYGSDYIDVYDSDDCQAHNTGCTSQSHGEGQEDEHIAGPGCLLTSGYSGANISLAEMRGCRAVRALVKKVGEFEGPWEDEKDDEPWERETKYFFSGL